MKRFLFIPLVLFLLSCEEKETATPDTTTPTVVITFPINNSTLTATSTIKADVDDDGNVVSVKFLIDGTEVYNDTSAPYEYEWDVCELGTGNHSVLVKAEDSAGNKGQSELFTFTIDATYDCADVCGGEKIGRAHV